MGSPCARETVAGRWAEPVLPVRGCGCWGQRGKGCPAVGSPAEGQQSEGSRVEGCCWCEVGPAEGQAAAGSSAEGQGAAAHQP